MTICGRLASNTGWGATHGVDRYLNKAQSHLLTGRFKEAEQELLKAKPYIRGGTSQLKQFRLGSSLALATLAQGKFVESAAASTHEMAVIAGKGNVNKGNVNLLARQSTAPLQNAAAQDHTTLNPAGGWVDTELQQLRRRRSGHAATDR